jgi:hypothetical protein
MVGSGLFGHVRGGTRLESALWDCVRSYPLVGKYRTASVECLDWKVACLYYGTSFVFVDRGWRLGSSGVVLVSYSSPSWLLLVHTWCMFVFAGTNGVFLKTLFFYLNFFLFFWCVILKINLKNKKNIILKYF